MFGIGGYQQRLLYQDGVYNGLMVATSSGLNVRVGTGLAISGQAAVEQTPTGATTDILLPAGATSVVFVNPSNALDANGSSLSHFGITPEANQDHVNINGTTGTLVGRSLPLAAVVVSANSATVTIAGTYVAADTVTVTINGHAIAYTVLSGDTTNTILAASITSAINADATSSLIVHATSALGVITITALTSGTVSAYSLTAAKSSTSGTAVASAANLGGAAVTAVDNTYRLKLINIPAATLSTSVGPYGLISY